ncbi:MAG TPA: ABC transporter permease [Gemmatimonadaceae bacterium]
MHATALLRRLMIAAGLMWLVVTLTFALLRLAPGDAATFLIPPGASADDAARVRAELGLDRSMPVQYARWLRGAVSGDLGSSFASGRAVSAVLAEAAPVSLALGAMSLALTFLIGVPIGMVQAARHRRPLDRILTAVTTAVYAAPTFWLALGFVALFTYGAATLGLPAWLRLPSFGLRTPGITDGGWAGLVDLARHALLPVSLLALVGAAGIARYARTSVLDVLRMDFVKTARGKGATDSTVFVRHVLANVLPSLIVLFALSLPGLLAGSIFVESVFAWPGLGRLTLNAILARDYPVIMGATRWYSGAVITANLLAELAMPLLDPRRELA